MQGEVSGSVLGIPKFDRGGKGVREARIVHKMSPTEREWK